MSNKTILAGIGSLSLFILVILFTNQAFEGKATATAIAKTQASVRSTLVAKATVDAAMAETALAVIEATPDQSVFPCSLGPKLGWHRILIPPDPLQIGDVVFEVSGDQVFVNVEGVGPWRLEFGNPVQLGPFVGLCFIGSGEDIVMIEGSKDIDLPMHAVLVP